MVLGPRAGPLASLAGACVPALHAAGYLDGGLSFMLATSRIRGSHPTPGACDPAMLATAMEVGGARELPTPMPTPICHTCSLSFWCCGAAGCDPHAHSPLPCVRSVWGVAVCACCVQALRAIHAKGVAHGDICEDNIIVADDGKVGPV